MDVAPANVFAIVWKECDSVREVTDYLNQCEFWHEPITTVGVVRAWESYLSEQGVQLKKLNRHGR
jgi:hypothetical protein